MPGVDVCNTLGRHINKNVKIEKSECAEKKLVSSQKVQSQTKKKFA